VLVKLCNLNRLEFKIVLNFRYVGKFACRAKAILVEVMPLEGWLDGSLDGSIKQRISISVIAFISGDPVSSTQPNVTLCLCSHNGWNTVSVITEDDTAEKNHLMWQVLWKMLWKMKTTDGLKDGMIEIASASTHCILSADVPEYLVTCQLIKFISFLVGW